MDYDKITEHVGEFGKYHKYVFFLTFLPAIFVGMNMLSYVFNSASPQHRCFINGCDNSSTSFIEPWLNISIPELNGTDFRFDQCKHYEINASKSFDQCSNFNTERVISCNEWKYDHSIYDSTVVTSWNLVCDQGWLAPLSGSMWMVGVIIGAILFGDLSDRFGRRKIIILSIVLFNITGFIIPFSTNYVMFLAFRVIEAASTTGIYQTAFVLCLEVVGQSKRVFCGVGINIAFALGEALLGVVAYFVRNWKDLQFYLAIPNIAFLFYIWILPESARWLIAQQRYPEAKDVIRRISVFNNKSVPLDLINVEDEDAFDRSTFSIIPSSSFTTSKKVTVIHLFRTPRLRWRTLNIFLNWFMNTVSYYGISMNATNLQGDVYLDFILTSLVEIPAYIFCMLVMNRLGRKKPLVVCMVLGGLCSMSTIFVPVEPKYQWVSVVLSLLGKFGCAAAFAIIYVFSIELFPTVLRNNGIGLSSTFAHIGGVIAPYIASLSSYGRAIPLLVFGSFSLTAGLFALFLPETLHQRLPETVEDAENFGRKKEKYTTEDHLESEALISENGI